MCAVDERSLYLLARSSTRKRYARIDMAHCAPAGGAHMHVLFAISALAQYIYERERANGNLMVKLPLIAR
jgi:hypothetical protein